jgi:outer membrane receptor protein involved in Fe transport
MLFKKSIKSLLFIFLLNQALVNAQEIKGVVSDKNNQPIENAYVYNINSTAHAHTLSNGAFILEDNKLGDTLNIGLLGYEKALVVVTESHFKNGLKITLKSKSISLNELVITEQVNAINSVSKVDLETNPVNSSQEILRKVPGLIIGQHAGGGKAEQLFLRGFDIDHGTDISISVDGMPVNMVSHAHGQGYSDLHFVIPETINKIDFGKGPYNADKGDFATTGYVGFYTKDNIKNSNISFGFGQFNSLRTLGMFDLLKKNSLANAYVAVEYIQFDGPYVSPQNFNRLNLFGKFTTYIKGNDKLSVSVSNFTSRWDASGQIPQRAVNSGMISRFGAIDDTEGGNTSRSNINLSYDAILQDNLQLKTNLFYTKYAFQLFSDFTFFLEDPVNGDQIKQKEDRSIYGFNTKFIKDTHLGTIDTKLTTGFGLRYDMANDVELSHTVNRKETLESLALGDINETNMYGFLSAKFELNKFTIEPALRLDYFKFMYNNALAASYKTQSETKTTLSPKFNVFFNQNKNLQWYLKTGVGFHSNDTRVVVQQQGKDILPKAYGSDFGLIWKPVPKMVFKSALWYLFLQQEFVYVGDAAIVEPSGKSERYGLDVGLRYQFADWLYFNTDATFTHARSIDAPDGDNFIPLAPDVTLTGGLSVNDLNKFSGGLHYRFIDDRPANEDNSIVAKGYFVTDLNMNYELNKNLSFGIAIENLFDTEWNETQFATESRLQNEQSPVEEIHFTPGTPFFIKGMVNYRF